MRNILFALCILSLFTPSCKLFKNVLNPVKIKDSLDVLKISEEIHSQFFEALTELNIENQINVIPQKLQMKMEHTGTTTASGQITYIIVGGTYKYQQIRDNSVTYVLAPPVIPTISEPLVQVVNFVRPSEAELKRAAKRAQSIKTIKDMIKSSANTSLQIQNFGVLNDKQVVIDNKFTFSNDGTVSITPSISLFKLFGVSLEEAVSNNNEIVFQFDVTQTSNIFAPPADYNHVYDSLHRQHNFDDFFPQKDFSDPAVVHTLVTPPIATQGSVSSCVAYSLGYTCLSTILNHGADPFENKNLTSPDFLYYNLQNGCKGLNMPEALSYVVNHGDCPLSDLPFKPTPTCPDPQTTNALRNDPNLRKKADAIKKELATYVTGWANLDPNNIDQIRLCLLNGMPVVVGFYISNSFMQMWNFDTNSTWGSQSGPYTDAHSVCIVGYDNVRQLFKVQNQWGLTNQRHDGFFYVTYDLVKKGCFNQAYTFLPRIP